MRQTGGMGPARISLLEIEAWERAELVELAPWERRAILKLDALQLTLWNVKKD